MTNHALTRLTLHHFRNYRSLTLDLPPQSVVLVGHNGAGKTSILEAISMLAPGRGLRGAKLRAMDRAVPTGQAADEQPDFFPPPNAGAWVVAAEITTRGEVTPIGTGRDPESTAEKRILKIHGERVRAQATLTQHVALQWLTPAMDQVFTEGNTARRKLLDRLVYGFDAEHAARVAAYEKHLRERGRVLEARGDPHWLAVLERQLAELGVAITLARMDALHRIREAFATMPTPFPRAALALEGAVESDLAEGFSALDAEAALAGRLLASRRRDASAGRALEGVHRSHFELIHSEKHLPVAQCSTGEQKAVLLSLILAAATARASWCGLPPILLLDEVIAHLDIDKRRQLFALIGSLGIQAWMTGTDAADFRGFESGVTQLTLARGKVLGNGSGYAV